MLRCADVGLGRVHLVSEWKEQIDASTSAAEPLLQMRDVRQLSQLMPLTQDPFLVLHFDTKGLWAQYSRKEQIELLSAWQTLALELLDQANVVAAVTPTLSSSSSSSDRSSGSKRNSKHKSSLIISDEEEEEDDEYDYDGAVGGEEESDGGILFDPSMRAVVYSGAVADAADPLNPEKFQYDGPGEGVDCSGVLLGDFTQLMGEEVSPREVRLRYFSDVNLLRKCVEEVMRRRGMVRGSIIGSRGMTTTQRGIAESAANLR